MYKEHGAEEVQVGPSTQLLQVERELLPSTPDLQWCLTSAHLWLLLPSHPEPLPPLGCFWQGRAAQARRACRVWLPVPHPAPGQQHPWTSPRRCALWARPVFTQARAPSWHHLSGTNSTEVTLISKAKQISPHRRAVTADQYGSVNRELGSLLKIIPCVCSVL